MDEVAEPGDGLNDSLVLQLQPARLGGQTQGSMCLTTESTISGNVRRSGSFVCMEIC